MSDCEGTKNLVAAAGLQGVKKFVLVTSIGVDDPLFPLNALWGVLFWKKQGEVALQRSGIDYTIVRPGGCCSRVHVAESRPVSYAVHRRLKRCLPASLNNRAAPLRRFSSRLLAMWGWAVR